LTRIGDEQLRAFTPRFRRLSTSDIGTALVKAGFAAARAEGLRVMAVYPLVQSRLITRCKDVGSCRSAFGVQ
jgi:hypothetical protein